MISKHIFGFAPTDPNLDEPPSIPAYGGNTSAALVHSMFECAAARHIKARCRHDCALRPALCLQCLLARLSQSLPHHLCHLTPVSLTRPSTLCSCRRVVFPTLPWSRVARKIKMIPTSPMGGCVCYCAALQQSTTTTFRVWCTARALNQ